jgi:hypothetical protein
MPRVHIALLMIVLVILSTNAAADVTQTFAVSDTLKGININADVAVSSLTGDALIVWEREPRSGTTKDDIYFVFAKRDSQSGYSLSKPKRLSAGAGAHHGPVVAYNYSTDSFLVAWHSNAGGGSTPAAIEYRLNLRSVSADGAPGGQTAILSQTGREISSLQLVSTPDDVGKPDADAAFLVFFANFPASDADEYTIDGWFLDEFGGAVGDQFTVTGRAIYQGECRGIFPLDVIRSSNGADYVLTLCEAHEDAGTKQVSRSTVVTRLNLSALPMVMVPVDEHNDSTAAKVLEINSELLLVGWLRKSPAQALHLLSFSGQGLTQGADVAPFSGMAGNFMSLVRTSKKRFLIIGGNSAFDVSAPADASQTVYARKLSKKGKTKGKEFSIFNAGPGLVDIDTAEVRAAAKKNWPIFVVWEKRVNAKKSEIHGFVYKP